MFLYNKTKEYCYSGFLFFSVISIAFEFSPLLESRFLKTLKLISRNIWVVLYVNLAIAHEVNRIVIGDFKSIKLENKMKYFVQIPHSKLIEQIKYKA